MYLSVAAIEQRLPAGETWFLIAVDSHYYPSCWLMPWNRRGSLPLLPCCLGEEADYAGQRWERRGVPCHLSLNILRVYFVF